MIFLSSINVSLSFPNKEASKEYFQMKTDIKISGKFSVSVVEESYTPDKHPKSGIR